MTDKTQATHLQSDVKNKLAKAKGSVYKMQMVSNDPVSTGSSDAKGGVGGMNFAPTGVPT